jgi:hypothetical protein
LIIYPPSTEIKVSEVYTSGTHVKRGPQIIKRDRVNGDRYNIINALIQKYLKMGICRIRIVDGINEAVQVQSLCVSFWRCHVYSR